MGVPNCIQEAWSYGLSTDNWSSQIQSLEAFGAQHGHVHVGFTSDENPELAKFARMQRSAWTKGSLAPDRYQSFQLKCMKDQCSRGCCGYTYPSSSARP